MKDEVRVHLVGSTIVLTIYIQDCDGNYVDPDSVTLTLYKPDGTKALDGVNVDREVLGTYVYHYNTESASPKGWWTAIGRIVDGTGSGARTTQPVGVFELK